MLIQSSLSVMPEVSDSMKSVLLTWYGITDFRASLGFESDGPVSGALAAEAYDQVVVLGYSSDAKQAEIGTFDDGVFVSDLQTVDKTNFSQMHMMVGKYSNTCQAHKWYCEWLESRIATLGRKTELQFCPVHLKELNDTEGIYEAALAAMHEIALSPDECLITLFLSPGTPVMAFVWAFAALNFPRVKKRLISSSKPGVPPEDILLPQEWMEWNGKRVVEPGEDRVELDMCFHLFGEQRLPSYWGMAQYPARCHVFVTSEQFDPRPLAPFLGTAKAFVLTVNAYDPEDVRAKIIDALEKAKTPVTARIGFNLTGGTKLMYAGAMAACRKINGFPFYFNQQENSVIDLLTFEKRAIKPIQSVETYLRLNGNGLHLSNAGHWKDVPEIEIDGRDALTQYLWTIRNTVGKHYKAICNLTDHKNYKGKQERANAKRGFAPFTYPSNGQQLADGLAMASEWDGSAEFSYAGITFEFERFNRFAKYITGGWFEEYVYGQLQQLVAEGLITDVRIGLTVSYEAKIPTHQLKNGTKIYAHKDERDYQEFDVLFTDGSRLYIVECKAGAVNSDYVVKLENEVRQYCGIGGRGILAACFPPTDLTVMKRIEDARLCRLVVGEDIVGQIRNLILEDRESYI